jgi:hypothetical protein
LQEKVLSFAKSEAIHRHLRKSSRSAAKTLLADYAAMPTSPPPVVPTNEDAEVSHKGSERSSRVAGPVSSDVVHEHRDPTATQQGSSPVEIGGRVGPEPTRYGDWEKNGRCIDF